MTYKNPTTPLAKIDRANRQPQLLPASSNLPPTPSKGKKRRKRLSLRAKTALTAIALATIPTTILGAIAYQVTANNVRQQINRTQHDRTLHLSQQIEKYLVNRVNEAKTLAESPIFSNPNVMEVITLTQKKDALDAFQDRTQFYDSIVYLDLEGNPLFQSQSESPFRENYGEKRYFQRAIEEKRTTLNELGISPVNNQPRVEFAVPVQNAWTDEVIGVLRFRIPSHKLQPIFQGYINPEEDWYLINTQGILFASSVANLRNQSLANYFPQIQQAHLSRQEVQASVVDPEDDNKQQLIYYEPIFTGNIEPDLNLGTAIALDREVAFAPLNSLRWIYLGGTIGTALLAGSIAGFLAHRIAQPISKITATIDEIGKGKLDTRVKLNRRDEVGVLGDRVDRMAMQLNNAMQRQQTLARTSELLTRISQARSSRELQLPFSLFLAEVRNWLKTDRVVFYHFDSQWWGTVIAESVAQGFPRTLGVQFDDPCFAKEYVRKYQRGRIQAIADIYQAGLTPCHIRQLEPYQVKASLVLPVILERPATPESEKLIGLAIAHQCSGTREWSQADVDYLQQVAYQLATVLRGYILYREENIQSTTVQKDLTGVLDTLKEVARGDLRGDYQTNAQASEINQSFAQIMHNLRDAIAKIKVPSHEINQELSDNKQNLLQMKESLQQQANQLALIFAFIEQISSSIVEVSSQVGTTSQTVDSIVEDLEAEKMNFSRAIAFMSQLENNLRVNRDKVKSLSSASQKMTKVIGSIRKINLRASLLASKLSKRIPELDESAFGLKEEIKSIQQSINATKELENVVRGIDSEISEVLREYQKSETNLEQENYLAANASKNLERIAKVTKNAQQNLFSLVNMTKIQQQTMGKIDNLKSELDETQESLTIWCDRTIESLDNTAVTAKDLENVVDFFKLDA